MKLVRTITALLLAPALVVLGVPIAAQDQGGGGDFSADQLEQLVAPIALYPDALLMQILMAATYPLEVVDAARWVQKNPGLKGSQLDDALKGEDWDPSVKSMCEFPDVLKRMNDNLDWTKDLGDAFLGQQQTLLDTVQRLRIKAHDKGNLKTTKEQTVTVQQDKTIVIQQADPQVIYVPTYDPVVVYGMPPPVYPYYPAVYAYPPGAAFFGFAAGVAVGAALWGGCSWGWGNNNVNVNVNNYNNYNKNTNNNWNQNNLKNTSGNKQNWQHNPQHREGVNYRNNQTAQKFGGTGKSNRVSQDQARGYAQNRGMDTGRGSQAGTGNRAGGQQLGGRQGAQQTGARQGGAQGGQRAQGGGGQKAGQGKDSAFSGASKGGSLDRSASSRGASSRSSSGAKSGGGSHGGAKASGGGRSGGGGGRKR